MTAFLKKHPIPVALAVALLAFFAGRMQGRSSATNEIRRRVLRLIKAGKLNDAIKYLGATPDTNKAAAGGDEE